MSHSPTPGYEFITGATAKTDAQNNKAPRAAPSDFIATDGYHQAADEQRVDAMSWLLDILAKTGLLATDLDYRLLRATMVIIFLFFGYQKWASTGRRLSYPI